MERQELLPAAGPSSDQMLKVGDEKSAKKEGGRHRFTLKATGRPLGEAVSPIYDDEW